MINVNSFSGRNYETQTIQFVGNSKVRTAPQNLVGLMQTHGFRFSTSAQIDGQWVMEYTRIVTRSESMPTKMIEKLGSQFKAIKNMDSVLINSKAVFAHQATAS